MKTLCTKSLVTYGLGIIFTLSSCGDPLEVSCPHIFNTLFVTAVDDLGAPVLGMRVTVFSLLRGDTLHLSDPETERGRYAIIDDSYKDRIVSGGELVRATGQVGERGFRALFRFGADENQCHLLKLSGPDTVVVR